MNANFTKLISSAAAVLAVGAGAYAQSKTTPAPSFEQGYGVSSEKFPAAYNAAARIDVQNSWDVFFNGSFTYWLADQEGMDLAYPTAPNDAHVVMQKFEFKPGFKVGMGMNFEFDNWVGAAEYTWFRSSVIKSAVTAVAPATTLTPTNWFVDSSPATVHNIGSKWRLRMDLADLTMSRPFYEGRKLTILPFGGVRGAWIRQNMHIHALYNDLAHIYHSHNHSNSWAVGPRAGFQGHWLLGWGFRLEGDVAGSILFTRYNVWHDEDYTIPSTNFIEYRDYNTLRPQADMNIGLGWGSYFDRQNYHFDLLATYDFNVFWGQNMMRALTGVLYNQAAWQPADLHVQGLTVTTRFDF